MNQDTAIEAFSALAQTSRLAIYRMLVNVGPDGLTATAISKRIGVVPSTLSGHLAVLKRAGLLTATRHSREIHYAANLGVMNSLLSFMLADCCGGQVENCSEILTLLSPSAA
ncbi:helix-turn-helix transcriptional regulator [Phaeobacter sp. 11ANDIMAR09]|uniref:ArsR/SmtB family transcription factor n=1 Tax=Phaeobacter sp. 11ANDIMAR09 TaxID=1225647 RepID=UPI0006C885C5|nr:metalloregulator ArsR/SmtB family transcription factor [Phaeobacter sp. 11ANDIMAR09]KPD10301.1 ArsR family transcriptional regulator [Phaeobacter sp. 11ANDIMAR09]